MSPGEPSTLIAASRSGGKFRRCHCRSTSVSGHDVEATLVGFWPPGYSSAMSVSRYHLHFINAARDFGGHVFELQAAELQVDLHAETDVHLVIPETRQFLEVDRGHDTADAY
ncbi:MAG: acetolactate decarboxylase [Planctomycetaceae bacterium]